MIRYVISDPTLSLDSFSCFELFLVDCDDNDQMRKLGDVTELQVGVTTRENVVSCLSSYA